MTSQKDFIDKLLLERIPLAGIARVVGVSECWLQGYVNRKYQEVQRCVDVQKNRKENRPFNVMKCGLFLEIKSKTNGFG
jgi:hypothetical protein